MRCKGASLHLSIFGDVRQQARQFSTWHWEGGSAPWRVVSVFLPLKRCHHQGQQETEPWMLVWLEVTCHSGGCRIWGDFKPHIFRVPVPLQGIECTTQLQYRVWKVCEYWLAAVNDKKQQRWLKTLRWHVDDGRSFIKPGQTTTSLLHIQIVCVMCHCLGSSQRTAVSEGAPESKRFVYLLFNDLFLS